MTAMHQQCILISIDIDSRCKACGTITMAGNNKKINNIRKSKTSQQYSAFVVYQSYAKLGNIDHLFTIKFFQLRHFIPDTHENV